jgi:hypothetical protein
MLYTLCADVIRLILYMLSSLSVSYFDSVQRPAHTLAIIANQISKFRTGRQPNPMSRLQVFSHSPSSYYLSTILLMISMRTR